MRLTLVVAGVVVALDVITKLAVMAALPEGQVVPIISGLLSIVHVQNHGAAYGLLFGRRWLLAGAAAGLVAALLWYSRQVQQPATKVACGLVAGGGIGNLIDRVLRGAVVDFISIDPLAFAFQVFNLADTAITCGVVLILVGEWRQLRAGAPALPPDTE